MSSIEVAAALLFRDGKLLITQRSLGVHLGGLWEFPGGKREGGETFIECLHRELQEELAIEVEVIDLIEAVTHEYPEKIVHLRFFRCRLKRGEPQRLGCPDFRWVNREELARFDFPEADSRLIRKLQANADLWPPSS